VSIDETACPFCGADRTAGAPQDKRFGRASRAAVFAGAMLATTACGGNKPKARDQQIDNTESASADAGVVEQGPDPDQRTRPDPDPNNTPMPYGAPPARRRVV
jgi:hypothetical protein